MKALPFAILAVVFALGCAHREPIAANSSDTPLDVAHQKFADNHDLIAYIEREKVLDQHVKDGIAKLKAEKDPGIKSQLGIVYIDLVSLGLMSKEQARNEVQDIRASAGNTAFYWDTVLKKIG